MLFVKVLSMANEQETNTVRVTISNSKEVKELDFQDPYSPFVFYRCGITKGDKYQKEEDFFAWNIKVVALVRQEQTLGYVQPEYNHVQFGKGCRLSGTTDEVADLINFALDQKEKIEQQVQGRNYFYLKNVVQKVGSSITLSLVRVWTCSEPNCVVNVP